MTTTLMLLKTRQIERASSKEGLLKNGTEAGFWASLRMVKVERRAEEGLEGAAEEEIEDSFLVKGVTMAGREIQVKKWVIVTVTSERKEVSIVRETMTSLQQAQEPAGGQIYQDKLPMMSLVAGVALKQQNLLVQKLLKNLASKRLGEISLQKTPLIQVDGDLLTLLISMKTMLMAGENNRQLV